jgi:hypothetical protein
LTPHSARELVRCCGRDVRAGGDGLELLTATIDIRSGIERRSEEQKNTPPNWTVIDQTGESMIEFGQFTVPPLGEAEEAIATYLTRFERAYPSAHLGHTLTNAMGDQRHLAARRARQSPLTSWPRSWRGASSGGRTAAALPVGQ